MKSYRNINSIARLFKLNISSTKLTCRLHGNFLAYQRYSINRRRAFDNERLTLTSLFNIHSIARWNYPVSLCDSHVGVGIAWPRICRDPGSNNRHCNYIASIGIRNFSEILKKGAFRSKDEITPSISDQSALIFVIFLQRKNSRQCIN